MNEFSLIQPNIELETEYVDMIDDWDQNDHENTPWFMGYDAKDFPSFVEKLNGLSHGIGVPEGLVESTTYWLIGEERKIIGAINIRHRLNEFYLNFAGQVGYGIRPNQRQKGYANLILKLGLDICKKMQFEKVLLCCYKNNIGSVKTIIKNGGVLDSEEIIDGKCVQRYWIKIK